MRVVLLTQWFDPEPTPKGHVFARELAKRGFDVEVVTGFPNYPGGKLYPGYRIRLMQREIIDGVNITRLLLYPSHDGSAMRRIANYTSFAAISLIYCLLFMRRPDAIYAYHPPPTVGVAAAFLRMLRHVPVIYDIQDIWPDTLRATGMLGNRRALGLIAQVCEWVYRKADRIVVLSPGFKRLLAKRGVQESKIDVIYNWADEAVLRTPLPSTPMKYPGEGRFCIVFAGNLGKAQALETVVDAGALLAATRPDICFILVGSGVEADALKRSADKRRLNNVHFIPRVPLNEIGAILAKADALLVHLKDHPLFAITIPSKTQAYMAIGKPLLMAVRGDAATLVEQAGCGVIAIPENPQSLAKAAMHLADLSVSELSAMAENSRQYYERELSFSVGVERFIEIFKFLAQD